MFEYETDPQRRPADGDQARPVAGDEPVRAGADSERSAASTVDDSGELAAGWASTDSGQRAASTASIDPSGPAGPWPPSGPEPIRPTWSPADGERTRQYPAGWSGQPVPAGSVQHPPPQPGYPGPVGPQPQPGYPGQGGYQPQPGYPGQASPYPAAASGPFGPPYPGGPVPSWGQPAQPRQAGRAGRAIAVGATALVLMLGSGVAGGFAALAVSDGRGTTFSAAPIIDSADLPAIAARVMDSVVSVGTDNGEGSGVVLTADGYVLTNNHVIATAGSGTVRVVFANGRTARAQIRGTDPKTDLAVLKAEGVSDLSPGRFGDSDAMRVGDTVLALGSPLGLQGSVTAGIISARDRTIRAGSQGDTPEQRNGAASISGLLQTDAPINPGNSGGALINTRGEVIGINTAIATAGQGSGNIGVGFAIPSNKAKEVAEKLQRGEKVSHPTLGVSVSPAENGGALVGSVVPGSPADRAGLRQGDVVTRFGDKVISDSNDLVAAVQAGKVGDQVELTFTRNGEEKRATVTLAEAS